MLLYTFAHLQKFDEPSENMEERYRILKVELEKVTFNLRRGERVLFSFSLSRDSSVGIATGYGLDDRGIGV
jgi:hypothetical protein